MQKYAGTIKFDVECDHSRTFENACKNITQFYGVNYGSCDQARPSENICKNMTNLDGDNYGSCEIYRPAENI